MNINTNLNRISEIMSLIPERFYYALLGEYVSIFGLNHIIQRSDNSFCFDTGTAGWGAALFVACKKLDLDWLYNEWISMEYYDSDTMDELIEDKLVKLIKDDHFQTNPYYEYIVGNNDI